MKIKEQTRKLAAGCSKHCFEVVDRTDEVSSKHCFEVVDRTDEVSNHTYGKAMLTWFEEIFEEYKVQIYLFVSWFTALQYKRRGWDKKILILGILYYDILKSID